MSVPESIIAIAAHPDDVEFGCFGTLAKYKEKGALIDVVITTEGGYAIHEKRRSGKIRRHWNEITVELESSMKLIDANFETLNNQILNLEVNGDSIMSIENILKRKDYDLVITHAANDFHQDHRATYQIVRSASRHKVKTLWQMEIPIYSNRNPDFHPNVFVDIEDHMEKKLSALNCYKSYVDEHMLSQVRGLAMFRAGINPNIVFAEAFYQEFSLG